MIDTLTNLRTMSVDVVGKKLECIEKTNELCQVTGNFILFIFFSLT